MTDTCCLDCANEECYDSPCRNGMIPYWCRGERKDLCQGNCLSFIPRKEKKRSMVGELR